LQSSCGKVTIGREKNNIEGPKIFSAVNAPVWELLKFPTGLKRNGTASRRASEKGGFFGGEEKF